MYSGKSHDTFVIPAPSILRVLFIVILFLVGAHSVVQFCWVTQACGSATSPINHYGYLFDLNKEANIPTWYSVVQLFAVAMFLALTAKLERARRSSAIAWWGLAAIFVYMSLDEATDMHGFWRAGMESFVIPGTNNAHFAWVIPGSLVVLFVAAIYLRWVVALPKRTRFLFILAGLVFVTGALVLETVGAFVADDSFRNTTYLIVSTAEEVLEMLGILIMLYAVLSHLEQEGGAFVVGLQPHLQQTPTAAQGPQD